MIRSFLSSCRNKWHGHSVCPLAGILLEIGSGTAPDRNSSIRKCSRSFHYRGAMSSAAHSRPTNQPELFADAVRRPGVAWAASRLADSMRAAVSGTWSADGSSHGSRGRSSRYSASNTGPVTSASDRLIPASSAKLRGQAPAIPRSSPPVPRASSQAEAGGEVVVTASAYIRT